MLEDLQQWSGQMFGMDVLQNSRRIAFDTSHIASERPAGSSSQFNPKEAVAVISTCLSLVRSGVVNARFLILKP